MFNYIFHSFYSFASKYRKHGFTLAEALIITIMTGACLLPILGTMQNAQVRTESFDHQSKMQQYSRSRLNAEIANAAFDHKSINLEDEYHYIAYFDKDGNENNAKLTEFPKTYVTPEEIASLSSLELASEWSDGSKEFLGIDETSQHYLRLVHAYRTTVETRENTQLAIFNNSPENTEETLDSPKALLAIIVKTCLLYSDGQEYAEDDGSLLIKTTVSGDTSTETGTETYTKDTIGQVVPVTLFSFVNLPTVSDEMIWMADALNCCVYGIDPYSRSISSTIKLPLYELIKGKKGKKIKIKVNGKVEDLKFDDFRPWHIAVHPSLKLLACATKKHLYLINIDKKSVDYGDYVKVFDFTSEVKVKGGIAFRPDGKYLFVCPERISGNDKLTSFEITYHIQSDKLVWDPENAASPEPKVTDKNRSGSIQNDKEIVAVLAANDGYLYVARKEKAYGVARYPMYCSEVENDETWIGDQILSDDNGIDGELSSIDVTPDGRKLAVVAGENLYIYDTREKKLILSKKVTEVSGVTNFKPNKVAFTAVSDSSKSDFSDSKNLYLTLSNKEEDKDCIAMLFYMEKTDTGYVLKKLRNIKYKKNKGGKYIVNSPDNSSVVIADKRKTQLYFEKSGISTSDEQISESDESFCKYSDVRDEERNCSDLASSKRDLLAVVEGSHTVLLYDLNTINKLEDGKFETQKDINSLSFNPLGTTLAGGYAKDSGNSGSEDAGHFVLHLNNLGKTDDYQGYRKRLIFDDTFPDSLFALEDPSEGPDAIWNINNNNKWNGAEEAYNRSDFSLDANWKRYEMIGMPNGGLMVLYGKTDGSSMLEWIGRRNWSQDPFRGNYRLFARWTSIKDSVEGTKTIPYSSFDSCGDTSDNWIGRVAIMKDVDLPVKGRVVSLNCRSVTWTQRTDISNDTSRSIVPLLLELQPNGQDFKIKDIGILIDFGYDTVRQETITIGWQKNNGIIENSNYKLGFWNGRAALTGPSSQFHPTPGAIPYVSDASNYAYVADYYEGTDSSISGIIQWPSILNSDTVLKPFDGSDVDSKKRRYALSFNITVSDDSVFPPLYSKKLAISPDCGTLAVLSSKNNGSTDEDKVPVLRLFDFNNYNFGYETQIEGWLVDYREVFHSIAWNGSKIVEPTYSWPNETNADFFKSVADNCHFGDLGIETLPFATTKKDTWSSFNKYPANYFISKLHAAAEPNITKETANKRFFGYFRPGFDVKYLDTYGSEDIRFFVNNKFIGGRTDVSGGSTPFDPPLSFGVKENSTILFQKDEASNVGGMRAQLFISNNGTNLLDIATNSQSFVGDTAEESYYKINDGCESLFDYIKSDQTYILNNIPSFISSYKVFDTDTKINMNYANMVFSRDRAKLVLYIKGENKLFVLFKNKLIKLAPGSGTNSKNIVISSDGQKLIFGKGNDINIYNISNPDESLFNTLTPPMPSSADDYLGKITSITLQEKPRYLASKPYVSYSSSKTGGQFELLLATNTVRLSSNAAAVSSGGIYMVRDDDRSIIAYNPITKPESFNIIGNIKKDSNSSAVAAYDDTIYMFGNAGKADDPVSGRVQSYDLKTNESRYTKLRTPDTFRTSIYYSSSNSYVVVEGEDNGVSVISNVFANNNSDWNTSAVGDHTTGDVTYHYSTNKPFVANKIIINNNSSYLGVSNGAETFRFVGINGSSEKLLYEGTLAEVSTDQVIDFVNETPYSKYKFYADTSYGDLTVGLKQLTMYRTDLVRLTPKKSSEITGFSASNRYMYYSNSKVASAAILWNSTNGEAHFYQLYQNLDSSYDNYEGGGGQSWQVSGTSTTPSLIMSFDNPEIIKFLRYSNGDIGYVSEIKIYGSNAVQTPDFSDNPLANGWSAITTISSLPNIRNYWIPCEIGNDNKFKHYLFTFDKSGSFKIHSFEVYGKVNTEDYMTPMLSDNLGEITVGYAAACSTPYGLVISGGLPGANATTTALLYWPHAVNKYDGKFYQYGISRSLPNMKVPRAGHALVWHKGKIYAIGGKKADKNYCIGNDFIECLDYNSSMVWQTKIPNYTDIEDIDNFKKRANFGACSFGDEIFMFDGEDGASSTPSAKGRSSCFAWNPESNVFRKINDTKTPESPNSCKLSPCVAVPFGSKIYVFGHDTQDNNNFKILEYTP